MPAYELTKTNASEIIPKIKNGTCVVLHHMNGCIHCEMFMPVWKEICQAYKNKKAFVLVSVEYSVTALLPDKMRNVQGFPTLRAYKNGSPVAEFNDNRTYDAVSSFIERYGNNEPVEKLKLKGAGAGAGAKAKAGTKKKVKKTA